MNTQPTPTLPLLRRSPFLPGESLPSLLERLAERNYYPHLGTLQRICHGRSPSLVHQDPLAHPYALETFLRLADLTRLAPEDLFAASSHCFAALLTPLYHPPMQIPWLDGTSKTVLPPQYANSRLHPVAAAQFCPVCLKTTPYHRLAWMPTAAALCLEHRCMLVTDCPGCQKPVSIWEIVRDRCRTCQTPLSAAHPVEVTEDALGLLSQEVIQCWWGTAASPPACGLPDQPPAALLSLLERLGRRVLTALKDWPALLPPLHDLADHFPSPDGYRRRLSPTQMYPLQRAAFTGIANWPEGLFQFLDAYRGGAAPDLKSVTYSNGLKRLDLLRQDWFPPKDPGCEFVQPPFVEYLLKRDLPLPTHLVERYQYTGWFVELTGLWTPERSAQALQLSPQDLQRFFSPYAKTGRWPGCRPRPPIFQRDFVSTIQQQWRLGWSYAEACTWLGLASLSPAQVARLVERDLWRYAQPPSRVDLADGLFTRQSVETFFEKVVQQMHEIEEEDDRKRLSPLDQALRMLAGWQLDQLDLLLAVLDGVLPAYIYEPERWRLRGVYFAEAPLHDFPETYYARRGWVTGHQFATEKGFSPWVILNWLEAGLINPQLVCGQHRFYERQRLDELTVTYVAPA